MVLDALEDTDAGPAAIDMQLYYRVDDLEQAIATHTWAWIRDRCYRLLDLPDTLIRKEATRGI